MSWTADRVHENQDIRSFLLREAYRTSPWQNGFAERLIGSIRRECVDHIIVLRRRICAGF
jgi:hypothetical protein